MFTCNLCAYTCKTWNQKREHYKTHRSFSTNFHCGYNGCTKLYKKGNLLRMHLIRTHGVLKKLENNEDWQAINKDAQFICNVSSCKKIFDLRYNFFQHIKTHIKDGITVQCFYPDCPKYFKNENSFSIHMSTYHRRSILNVPHSCNIEREENTHLINENDMNTSDPTENLSILINSNETNLSNFYLKLETEHLLPQASIDEVSGDFENIYNQSQLNKYQYLEKELLSENLPQEKVVSIIEELKERDVFLNQNKLLNTKFKRNKYYRSQSNYVAPQRIIIKETPTGQKTFFHYVPIIQTIKALYSHLSLKNYLDQQKEEVQDDNVLNDFFSGKIYKGNEYFQNNPDAIKIILFQDSFEVVNPIGSGKKKHKIIGIYMSIGNLPNYVRTHVKCIQLVALVKEKWFEHDKVFGYIVKDLIHLETIGAEITEGVFKKGGVVFIAGDNLGSHSLGGFIENFSRSLYFCRYCLVTRDDFFKTELNDYKFEHFGTSKLRDVQSYNNSITELSVQKQLKSYEGIKFDSTFNQLQSFHVCKPGLPPCFGHDLMEGIVAYDLADFITYFVSEKWFTYDKINYRLSNFNFSPDDGRNKPIEIENNSKKIVGSAWQIQTLLRFFPLIVRDEIKDPDNPVWHILLLLSEISEILCSLIIHRSFLPYLQIIINEYLSMRKELIARGMRPKHHYLEHYPHLIDHFGPLINVWTMRFESKHSYFKRIIRNTKNFINVTHSLSIKHERQQILLRNGFKMKNIVDISEQTNLNISLYSHAIQLAIEGSKLKGQITTCRKIIFKGSTFNVGNAIILRQKAYQYCVEIGRITLILVDVKDEVEFIVEKVITSFNPLWRFYEITNMRNKKYECVSINTIPHTALHIYTIADKIGIKLKHALAYQSLES